MVYVKREVSVPRLAGNAMRAFAAALDVPGVGAALRHKMMADAGVHVLRERATDAPQWSPTRLLPVERALAAPLDLDAIAGTPRSSGPPTIARLAQKYRARDTTPTKVAEQVIDAVAASERATPAFRFFIAHDADDVRAQAVAAEQRLAAGRPLSILDGVPVAIKDEVDQRGYPTTGGTRFLGRDKATADAFSVKRLRDAGAVLIGKTNMHELGIGTTGQNPHHGTPRNPHDPSRYTGGSSSGSGAVVASGIVPLALGADGGGSIRNPAALCGVVGLKPTFGRVSEHGAVPICWSVAHIGPLGATVDDCALGYAVMAGPDAHDVHSARQPPVSVPRLDGDVRGMRIGVYREWIEDSDADVSACVLDGLSRLQARGAVLVDVEIEDLDILRVIHLITICTEMAAAQQPHFHSRASEYAVDTRIIMQLVSSFTPFDYVHAQRHRSVLCDAFDRLLRDVDAIATPSVGCTAPPIHDDALAIGESDLKLLLKIMRFAPAANITGLPAISVPCGRGAGGLPVGMMLMGRAFDEGTLLRLAKGVELDCENGGWLVPRTHHALW